MTEKELQNELNRIVEDEYPLIASEYIDIEVMLLKAQSINPDVREWRGVDFPYKELHKLLMGFVEDQFWLNNGRTSGILMGNYLSLYFANLNSISP